MNTSKEAITVHELKTWPEYFQQVKSGAKTFEVRKNDRNYKVGDILHLREWNPKGYSSVSPNELTGEYSGRELRVTITYILQVLPHQSALFGIDSSTVVMAISSFKEQDTVSEEDRLVEDILSEFEKIGIDTSEWEYKFGDGNFAHEFIAAGVRDHIENLQKKEQDTDVPNGGPTHRVENDYWLREYPKSYMPETEEELQDAINEEHSELGQISKYIKRGDNGKWMAGQHLIVGKDFEIVNDVAIVLDTDVEKLAQKIMQEKWAWPPFATTHIPAVIELMIEMYNAAKQTK